jgi:hypothetical protein
MPANTKQFTSSFKSDLAKNSLFEVFIYGGPTAIFGAKYPTGLNYRCENANLPGKTIATMDQKIYGPIEKFPYLTTYNDIDLTFIVDGDMQQKYFFEDWLYYINPTNNYNFKYKKSYAGEILIKQFQSDKKRSYAVTLSEAYPISINQMDLDWSSESYHKLTVTFAYTDWNRV